MNAISPRRAPKRQTNKLPTTQLKLRIRESLAREIGTKILNGEYAPGEVLPGEIAASENLKISRTAYREAMRILAAKGLLESRQKAGTLVTERSRWNLLDPDVLSWMLSGPPDLALRESLFELRMIVEPAAAALAAKRRQDDDLAEMESALTEMRVNPPDSPIGAKADERFHAAVIAAGGNELLSRLTTIVAASVEYIAEWKRSQHIDRDTWPDHKALFDAIRARRGAKARDAMADLISHARADLSD